MIGHRGSLVRAGRNETVPFSVCQAWESMRRIHSVLARRDNTSMTSSMAPSHERCSQAGRHTMAVPHAPFRIEARPLAHPSK
jgi:hypothetical protein